MRNTRSVAQWKYMASCRLILLTESVSKLIPALRSRCLGVRVSAPTETEIEGVLEKVAMAEMFEMGDEQKRNLARVSGRNLRKALHQKRRLRFTRAPQTITLKSARPMPATRIVW